jgi:RHS repeat-associated protein
VSCSRWLAGLVLVLLAGTATHADAQSACPPLALFEINNSTAEATAAVRCDHPDIFAKAQELGTPLAMYQFVRNEIDYEVYYGQKKGALGTLWTGRGNDFDQAALLMALFRSVGIPARWGVGTVDVHVDQLEQWAGVPDGDEAVAHFFEAWCRSNANAGPCATAPKRRFLPAPPGPSGDVPYVSMEHAWVEVLLPVHYRGAQLGSPGGLWIPLDPSWTQKDYPSPFVFPIGSELEPGGCSGGAICFDYAGYLSKLDPWLPTERWIETLQAWLDDPANGLVGSTPLDAINGGPILPDEGEVLPTSLPYTPYNTFTASNLDSTTVPDGITRAYFVVVTIIHPVNGSEDLLAYATTLDMLDRSFTIQFGWGSTQSKEAQMVAGGYFGGPYGTAASLFDHCAAVTVTPPQVVNPAFPECFTLPLAILDNFYIGFPQVLTAAPLGHSWTLRISVDESVSLPRAIELPVSIGETISLVPDPDLQRFAARRDRLLEVTDLIPIVDEGDVDLNGNGVAGETLVDQGTPGISVCPAFVSSNYFTCDIDVSAIDGTTHLLVGELLDQAALRWGQRARQALDEMLQIDGYSPIPTTTPVFARSLGGFQYLFDQPVGVIADFPVLDVHALFPIPSRSDGSPPTMEGIHRELYLAAHTASALEHQVWEEVTGTEFMSTVKGMQLVRERFPGQPLRTFTPANAGTVPAVLGGFPFDTISSATRGEIQSLAGAAGTTVTTPIAAIDPASPPIEVYLVDRVDAAGGLIRAVLTAGGFTLGGASGFLGMESFESFAESVYDEFLFTESELARDSLLGFGVSGLDLGFTADSDTLFRVGSLSGDQVAMVSGNLNRSEVDVELPTDGPPLVFARSYNSQGDEEGALGHGWLHRYEQRVERARGEQVLVVLPQEMLDFPQGGTLEGVLSDAVGSSNSGSGLTEEVIWNGLSLGPDVSVTEIEIQLGFTGGDLRVTHVETGEDYFLDPEPGSSASVGTFTLRTAGGAGSFTDPSFVHLEIRRLDSSDSITFARMLVHYEGPPIQRTELAASAWSGWDSGASPPELVDADPSTCASPTSQPATASFAVPPIEGRVIALEIEASVLRASGTNTSRIDLAASPATPDERHLTGPLANIGLRHRFHTMRDPASPSIPAMLRFDGGSSGTRVELCQLTYRVIAIPETVEYLTESGARERFVRSGSAWVGDPGVRGRLEDLTPSGFRVTEPDGTTLDFDREATAGRFQLTRIRDPQGRGLDLVYGASGRLDRVQEDDQPSAHYLQLGYDASGRLSSVSDWSGRTWSYTVDAAGDLVNFRDAKETANAWAGTIYSYYTAADGPELAHNLRRVERDADGMPGDTNFTDFEYDLADRVTAHTDALGNRYVYHFNTPRREGRMIDPRGFETTYRFDAEGNLVQRLDADGAIWRWEYDGNRNVVAEVDPLGFRRELHDHDSRGNPGRIVDRDGREVLLTYDPVSGAPSSTVDKRGLQRSTVFTADGLAERMQAQVEGVGGGLVDQTLVETEHHPVSRRVERVFVSRLPGAPERAVTHNAVYSPDDRDVLEVREGEDSDGDGSIDILHRTRSLTYDTLGRLETQSLVRTNDALDPSDTTLLQVRLEYSLRDEVVRLTRPDGTVLVSQYDRNGNKLEEHLEEAIVHESGTSVVEHNRTSFRYDALDRLVETIDAQGNVTRFAHDAVGNRISVTDPEGGTTRFEYDGLNRLLRTIDPNGAVIRNEYDPRGRLVATTDPTGLRTSSKYDPAGELVEMQVGGSPPATRQILYDDDPSVPVNGLHHLITDPTGAETRIEFDALGRPARVLDARSGETFTEYYLDGELRKLTDPDGGESLFGRDSLGRVTSLGYPHFATSIFEQQTTVYDELDNPILVTRPNGCAIELHYDTMGRMTRRRSFECVGSVGPAPTAIDDEYGYDARGNLVAMRNAHIGLVREYDTLNRLLREIDDRVGTGVAYTYDRAGRVTSKVLPDRTTLQLSYDPAGRVVGLADPFGDLTQIRHDAAGRTLERSSRASGLRTELAYDARGRLSEVRSFASDGTPATSAVYPLYDDVGNRLRKQTGAGTTDYEYDELHRLIRESVSGEPDARYTYSGSGDRLQGGEHDGTAFTLAAFSYTYRHIGSTPTHQLESAANGLGESRSFAYDENGEVYQWTESGPAGTRTLTRDALGRIVSISGAGFSGSYAYDPMGRRIEKIEQGEQTLYQHDRDQVVAEYSSASVLEAIYVFGPGLDEPLKVKRGAVVAAYHAEGLGSVTAITSVQTAAGLATYDYDAFGVLVGSTGSFENAYTFTGRELDASGLYYFRGRYYLPAIGRFLSPDPAGLADGTNVYAYVGSNPVNFVDPFGLFRLGAPVPPATCLECLGGVPLSFEVGAVPGSDIRPINFDLAAPMTWHFSANQINIQVPEGMKVKDALRLARGELETFELFKTGNIAEAKVRQNGDIALFDLKGKKGFASDLVNDDEVAVALFRREDVQVAVTLGDHQLQGIRIWYALKTGPREIAIATAAFERPNGVTYGANWLGFNFLGAARDQQVLWDTFLGNIDRTYFGGTGQLQPFLSFETAHMVNPFVGYVAP